MVGSVVHCAECGKPFHVEEGSSIQVARAVPPPIGPRPRRRKVPRWVWIAGVCVALLLFFAFVLSVVRMQRHEAAAWGTVQHAKTAPPVPMKSQAPQDPFWWKSALGSFPAEATLFGAVRFSPFGAPTLDDDRMQTALRFFVPAEVAGRLTPENLGRIRLDGVGVAYYPETKTEEARAIVHLQGVALDGRKRIVDFIRQSTAEKTKIEEKDVGSPPTKIRVSDPELPVALGLLDDYNVFLARSLKPGAAAPQHLKALERLSWFDFHGLFSHPGNLVDGYNPPWVKGALASIPADGCGFLIGEIPAEWRKRLSEALQLRVCPRTVSFYLTMPQEFREVVVSVTFSVDKAGEDLMLKEDLDKWGRQGLDVLKARFPALRNEAGSLALVGQTLKTMRWQADRGNVRTDVRFGDRTWKALGELVKRAAP
jgi:hypothetical protein